MKKKTLYESQLLWLLAQVSRVRWEFPHVTALLQCHQVPNALTGAGHGGRVRLGAKVSLVTHAGGGSLPDGVAVQRTLRAGAVCGQGTIVADLADWGNKTKVREIDMLVVNGTGSSKMVQESHLCPGWKMC